VQRCNGFEHYRRPRLLAKARRGLVPTTQAANQWLIQNNHSKTLAKARFSAACRSIFRETCLRARLRFVSA